METEYGRMREGGWGGRVSGWMGASRQIYKESEREREREREGERVPIQHLCKPSI
jgi:hypothetical protein